MADPACWPWLIDPWPWLILAFIAGALTWACVCWWFLRSGRQFPQRGIGVD